MTNRQELAHQVSTTLGDHAEDFNINAIVEDLIAIAPGGELETIDAISNGEYNAVIQRHDKTAIQD